MGYQWVSILGLISVKDIRYTYILFLMQPYIDSFCEFLVSVSVNIGRYCTETHISNTSFWQLPAICKYKDIKITNRFQIDPALFLPKNSIGDRTARLIPS